MVKNLNLRLYSILSGSKCPARSGEMLMIEYNRENLVQTLVIAQCPKIGINCIVIITPESVQI